MRLAGMVFLLAAVLCAQSIQSDQAALARMRELTELTDWEHQPDSAKGRATPLWGGLDDDPTLDADTFAHEPAAAARKAARRAEHLTKKGQHEEAIAEFKKALRIDPEYYQAENNLALEYFDAGHSDLALATLERLTKSDPKHVLAFDNLAIVLLRLKRYAEAEEVATRAYHAHLFSYKAAYLYGASLADQGKWTDDAKQALRYASARHPEANELLAKWPEKGAGRGR